MIKMFVSIVVVAIMFSGCVGITGGDDKPTTKGYSMDVSKQIPVHTAKSVKKSNTQENNK
jgi:hypothetical protein